MKLLIEKSNNKVSNIVKLEMLSTEFNSVTKLIKENEIPVVVFTDTNESYLINNINEVINNARNNTEVSLDIVLNNLISLGGSSGSTDSRPYKVYTAILNQTGTNAPVATVLENTLNLEGTYTRYGEMFPGVYYGQFNQDLPLGRTVIFTSNNNEVVKDVVVNCITYGSEFLDIYAASGSTGGADNLIKNCSIEIRVFDEETTMGMNPGEVGSK
jgi:hypothetical protein